MKPFTLGDSLIFAVSAGLAIVMAIASFILMRRAKVQRVWLAATLFASSIGIWLCLVSAVSVSGWLSEWNALPPRVPLLLLLAIASYLGVTSTKIAKATLATTPRWLPILIQSFRLVVESALWQLHREGSVPIQFTFEGRNLDMLTGLTAPLVALGVAIKWLGPQTIVVWNLLGMALLFNAIVTAATSSPGPQHHDWPGEPFTAIATWPLIWLPTFLAPTAVFLHVVSLRQSTTASRSPNSCSSTHEGLANTTRKSCGLNWRG